MNERVLFDGADLDAEPVKFVQNISDQFEPAKAVVEDIGAVGFSLLVNYNIRGYEHFETTYPDDWVREYVNRNYHVTDPVLVWSLMRQGTCRWSETRIPDLFGVAKKATKFGLAYGGVWSRKTGQKRTVLFAARSDREFADDELEDIGHEMNLFFDAVSPNLVLSIGEIDVLKLIMTGDSTNDVAKTLGITESAVKARVSSARTKMGCKTTPQLIYRCMQDGIFQ